MDYYVSRGTSHSTRKFLGTGLSEQPQRWHGFASIVSLKNRASSAGITLIVFGLFQKNSRWEVLALLLELVLTAF